jgi:hypothetical protein
MANIGIMGIIVTIIFIAVGSAIGLAMVAQTSTTFTALNAGPAANNAYGNVTSIIYSSWPLLGLAVLALIGGAVLAGLLMFRG